MKSKPAALDAILRTPDIGLSLQWTPAFAGRHCRASGRPYLLGMNCYPTMLMKNKELSDGAGRFRMTWVQNQLIEIQAFSRVEVRPGQREKKDVNNDERSQNVL